jgi:ADP-ribosylglycohydrolase
VAQALPGATSAVAASVLGSGREVSAQDTVPFAVWAAAHHLGDVVETFWTAVAGLGDRDTTSAMACGIVAAGTSADGIPPDWLVLVEPLPAFVPPAGSAPPAAPGPPAESGSGS